MAPTRRQLFFCLQEFFDCEQNRHAMLTPRLYFEDCVQEAKNFVSQKLLRCGIFFAAAALSQAATIAIGTPGNSTLSSPTGPTFIGTLINFDNLAQSSGPVASVTTGGVTVSSSDGLEVIPYSTMSYPNEVFDDSSNGSADLAVMLGAGTDKFGIGIADSDGVSITLQALGAGGSPLGSAFSENLNNTDNVYGNSYFIISDTAWDIRGVSISQSTGSANYSGLAIDDVQFQPVPEPSAFALLSGGLVLLGGRLLRKKI